MKVNSLWATAVAAGLLSAATAGVAFGSAAPLPHTAKDYSTGAGTHPVSLGLIISASNPKQILAGPKTPPIGSQFPLSVGSLQCPHAERNPGLPKSQTPFMLFSFPGARLKLSHGKYAFSASSTVRQQTILGSTAKPFELKLKFTGKVLSATRIVGTVSAHGGPCSPKTDRSYTARLQPNEPVAPGQ